MIQFWLVCFGILFVIVQLWEWLQQLTLTLPVYFLGGIILAIASNIKISKLTSQLKFLQLFQSDSKTQSTNTTSDSISN